MHDDASFIRTVSKTALMLCGSEFGVYFTIPVFIWRVSNHFAYRVSSPNPVQSHHSLLRAHPRVPDGALSV